MTQINAYDDYGIPQGKTPAGAVFTGGTATAQFGRFGYTGQAWLPEVGLSYYKNRMYSPTLGRFMQTDPIEYEDGVNLYAYVGGDPINFNDPLGLNASEVRNMRKRVETCNDPCEIVVRGSRNKPEPDPSPKPTSVAFLNGDPFAGRVGSGGERGGDGKAPENKETCQKDAGGMCDSSHDSKARVKKLHKEQCARLDQIDNLTDSDVGTVAGPLGALKNSIGYVARRVFFVTGIPKFTAALGRLINRANGVPCP